MRNATIETIQKALDRIASLDVQLTSSAVRTAVPRAAPCPTGPDEAVPDCPVAAGARAPSGSSPMSSGRRRMTMIMGMARNRLKKPMSRKAVRQSASSVMTANAWMINAPLMGR